MKESRNKFEKGLAPNVGIPTQNRYALKLLRSWMAEPDDLGEAWWNEFERNLRENRFKLRTLED